MVCFGLDLEFDNNLQFKGCHSLLGLSLAIHHPPVHISPWPHVTSAGHPGSTTQSTRISSPAWLHYCPSRCHVTWLHYWPSRCHVTTGRHGVTSHPPSPRDIRPPACHAPHVSHRPSVTLRVTRICQEKKVMTAYECKLDCIVLKCTSDGVRV